MSYRERRSWTAAEDQLLREAIAKEDPTRTLNPSKWHAISRHVPNRNNKDCRKRWFAKLAKADGSRGNWSPEEDERLLEAIEKHGPKWTTVSSIVQTRNSDQCAKRWKDTLNPAIDRTTWTAAEDETLIEAVKSYGNVWSKIVKAHFPRRTGLAAKNRYNSLMRCNGGPGLSKLSPSPTLSDASISFYSGSSGSSSAASPITPTVPMPELSISQFSQCYLDNSYAVSESWSAEFSDFQDLSCETLALEDLFTLSSLDSFTKDSYGVFSSESLPQALPYPQSSTMLSHSVLLSPSAQQSSANVLKLFGRPHCIDTIRIQIILHEKKIPYETVNLNTFNPQAYEICGQTSGPFIEEDGFILCDSRTICSYLATKYADQGTKLIPDAYDTKLAEEAVFTEVFDFEPYAATAVYEQVTKRLQGLAPDEAVLEASIAGLSSKLDGYEDILGQQRYLAGDQLTLADLYHIPAGALLTNAGSDIMTRKGPNMTRWWNDISSRPSCIAVQNGDPVQL